MKDNHSEPHIAWIFVLELSNSSEGYLKKNTVVRTCITPHQFEMNGEPNWLPCLSPIFPHLRSIYLFHRHAPLSIVVIAIFSGIMIICLLMHITSQFLLVDREEMTYNFEHYCVLEWDCQHWPSHMFFLMHTEVWFSKGWSSDEFLVGIWK